MKRKNLKHLICMVVTLLAMAVPGMGDAAVILPDPITTFPFVEDFEGGAFPAAMVPNAGSGADLRIDTYAGYNSTYGALFEGETSTGWGSTPYNVTAAFAADKVSHFAKLEMVVEPSGSPGTLKLEFDFVQRYSFNANYEWFRVLVDGVPIPDEDGNLYHQALTHTDAWKHVVYDLSAYQGLGSFDLTLQNSAKYYLYYYYDGDLGCVDNLSLCYGDCGVAPTVTTRTALTVQKNSAVLRGTVNANDASTAVTFEYGTSKGYGTTVSAGTVTGTSDTAVSKAIYGLTPNTIYHFRVVGENPVGTSNGADMTFRTDTLPRFGLSVTKAGTGSGTVQSNIPGINCGQDCLQYYNAQTTISLTSVPDEGSTFEGWSGECSGTGECKAYMIADKTVTATFSKIDSDGDGTPDEDDLCPDDPDKADPGACGCGLPDSDDNNNGIPDCLDTDNGNTQDDPDDNNIPDDLDLDGNNIPDQDQTDMRVVPNGTGNIYFGIAAPLDVELESLEWIDASVIDETDNRPDSFPLGLVTFRVLTANPGDTIELAIYCSEPIPDDAAWYKYDPVFGWFDYSDFVVISEDRMSLTLQIEDGGFGDADGEVNGVIEDPSGPGLFDADNTPTDNTVEENVNRSGSSSSSGCFLEAITTE